MKNRNRVVITGIGVVASNAIGKDNFLNAIKNAKSGIKKVKQLEELNFGCQIAGIPDINNEVNNQFFEERLIAEAGNNVKYTMLAGKEAWEDAGLKIPEYDSNEVDYDTGVIIGTGVGNIDIFSDTIFDLISSGNVRKLRSHIAEFTMISAASANLSGMLAVGNIVTSNSSACSTGNESIIQAYERIRNGKAKRMIAGGCEIASPYIWGCFDSMRILSRKYNDEPERGSRPMSMSANGFVPSAGAGILILEELNTALERNAKIYAEIKGSFINSGGQRNGGTMQAPGPEAVQICIRESLKDASVKPEEIDYIAAHLSSTMADVLEIKNWVTALRLSKNNFPYINSLKSLTGHGLGAAGALEVIAAVLQLYNNFIFPNKNCEDLHPEIQKIVNIDKILMHEFIEYDIENLIKASFGFGDINSCIVLGKFNN